VAQTVKTKTDASFFGMTSKDDRGAGKRTKNEIPGLAPENSQRGPRRRRTLRPSPGQAARDALKATGGRRAGGQRYRKVAGSGDRALADSVKDAIDRADAAEDAAKEKASDVLERAEHRINTLVKHLTATNDDIAETTPALASQGGSARSLPRTFHDKEKVRNAAAARYDVTNEVGHLFDDCVSPSTSFDQCALARNVVAHTAVKAVVVVDPPPLSERAISVYLSDLCAVRFQYTRARACRASTKHPTCFDVVVPCECRRDGEMTIFMVHDMLPLEVEVVMASRVGHCLVIGPSLREAWASLACGEVQYCLRGDGKAADATLSVGRESVVIEVPSYWHNGVASADGFSATSTAVQGMWNAGLVFRETETEGLTTTVEPLPVVAALADPTYYGPSIGNPLFRSTIECVGDTSLVSVATHLSAGPYHIFWDHSTPVPCVVPKHLIDDLRQLIAGKQRTPESFALLTNRARTFVESVQMPAHIVSNAIFASAAIAFCYDITYELGVMHAVMARHAADAVIHGDALKFKFKPVLSFPWSIVTAVRRAATAVLNYAVSGVELLTAEPGEGGDDGDDTAPELPDERSPEAAFSGYDDTSRLANGSAVVVFREPVELPATPPTIAGERLTGSEIRAQEISSHAAIRYGDVDLDHDRDTHGPVLAGIGSRAFVPRAPTMGAPSEAAAVVYRQLARTTDDEGKFDEGRYATFVTWVRHALPVLFPRGEPVTDTDRESWNSTYDAAMRVVHERARERAIVERQDDDFRRGCFIKMELLLKDRDKFIPRLISSCTHERNATVSSTVAAVVQRLKSAWSMARFRSGGSIWYANGYDTTSAGEYADVVKARNLHTRVVEIDISKADACQGPMSLMLHILVGRYMGLPHEAAVLMADDIHFRGTTPSGIKFSTFGTLGSGSYYTSIMHSITLTLVYLFVCCRYNHMTVEELLQQIALGTLGDDNICAVSDKVAVDTRYLVEEYAKLGYRAEANFHVGADALYRATFCSSRFVPCDVAVSNVAWRQSHTLLNMLGRFHAKAFWYAGHLHTQHGVKRGKLDPTYFTALAACDAIGRARDFGDLPFYSQVVSRVIKLTSVIPVPGRTKAAAATALRRLNKWRVFSQGQRRVRTNDCTWAFFSSVYGLTREHAATYGRLLQRVTALPAVVDYAPLAAATALDLNLAPDGIDIVELCTEAGIATVGGPGRPTPPPPATNAGEAAKQPLAAAGSTANAVAAPGLDVVGAAAQGRAPRGIRFETTTARAAFADLAAAVGAPRDFATKPGATATSAQLVVRKASIPLPLIVWTWFDARAWVLSLPTSVREKLSMLPTATLVGLAAYAVHKTNWSNNRPHSEVSNARRLVMMTLCSAVIFSSWLAISIWWERYLGLTGGRPENMAAALVRNINKEAHIANGNEVSLALITSLSSAACATIGYALGLLCGMAGVESSNAAYSRSRDTNKEAHIAHGNPRGFKWAFKYHGNWGGPNYSNATEYPERTTIDWNGPVVDEYDALYRAHDAAYDNGLERDGDQALVNAIDSRRGVPFKHWLAARAFQAKANVHSRNEFVRPAKWSRVANFAHSRSIDHGKNAHIVHGNIHGKKGAPLPKRSKRPAAPAKARAQATRKRTAKPGKAKGKRANARQASSSSSGVSYAASTLPVSSQTTHHSIVSYGADHVRVRGRQRVTDVSYVGTPTPGLVVYTDVLSAPFFANTKLREFFNSYEKWQPHHLAIELVPGAPTTTPGKYLIFIENDPADQVAVGQSLSLDAVANRKGIPEVSMWGAVGRAVMDVDRKAPDFYTTPTINIADATSTFNQRLNAPGCVAVVSGVGVGANPTFGTLYVVYDFTFRVGTESDNETMAINAYGMAIAVDAMSAQTASHSVDINDFMAIARKKSAVASPTYRTVIMSSPGTVDFTGPATSDCTATIRLPPGEYVVRTAVAVSGTMPTPADVEAYATISGPTPSGESHEATTHKFRLVGDGATGRYNGWRMATDFGADPYLSSASLAYAGDPPKFDYSMTNTVIAGTGFVKIHTPSIAASQNLHVRMFFYFKGSYAGPFNVVGYGLQVARLGPLSGPRSFVPYRATDSVGYQRATTGAPSGLSTPFHHVDGKDEAEVNDTDHVSLFDVDPRELRAALAAIRARK